jgi:hypothetical protein
VHPSCLYHIHHDSTAFVSRRFKPPGGSALNTLISGDTTISEEGKSYLACLNLVNPPGNQRLFEHQRVLLQKTDILLDGFLQIAELEEVDLSSFLRYLLRVRSSGYQLFANLVSSDTGCTTARVTKECNFAARSEILCDDY